MDKRKVTSSKDGQNEVLEDKDMLKGVLCYTFPSMMVSLQVYTHGERGELHETSGNRSVKIQLLTSLLFIEVLLY